MCGRFALDATEEALIRQFGLHQGFKMAARYNIAPSTVIPIVRNNPAQLDFVRWGFIPSWAKAQDPMPKGHINARAETVFEKPTFRSSFKSARCLIPACGYYEWKTIHEKKQPFYITVQDKPLVAFAGIWSSWKAQNQEVIETAAIITVEASEDIARVHNRMPLIFDESSYDTWLDAKTKQDEVINLLSPQAFQYKIFPVSPRVNNPRFDSPVCLQPLS